jgi:SAM-dependent methyltransferase
VNDNRLWYESWLQRASRRLYEHGWLRFLPWSFARHYLFPLLHPRRRSAYEAQAFWSRWYSDIDDLTDAATISKRTTSSAARFHYNAVENSMLAHFAVHPPPARPSVLDVGSGAGHWVAFSLDVLDSRHVTAVDLSEECVERLRNRFASDPRVRVRQLDASQQLDSPERFDLIIAIGVMFHIVDDDLWRRALANLATSLSPGGKLVIGGHFGLISVDAQVHREQAQAFVNKRLRSLRMWRRQARRCGLSVEGLVRTARCGAIITPQNNVLVLSRPKTSR